MARKFRDFSPKSGLDRIASLPKGARLRYIGSTKRIAAKSGALYGFVYSRRSANDKYPLVLVCKTKGLSNFWYSKSGNRYMSGLNVNYMMRDAPTALALIIEKIGDLGSVTYKQLESIASITASNFRTYDVRRVQDLYLVDISKYLEENRLNT